MDWYSIIEELDKKGETWDTYKHEFVDTPPEMIEFLCEINEICQKYNLSISHEDGHGSFEIQRYKDSNIRWLKSAHKDYL